MDGVSEVLPGIFSQLILFFCTSMTRFSFFFLTPLPLSRQGSKEKKKQERGRGAAGHAEDDADKNTAGAWPQVKGQGFILIESSVRLV